jgi:hypothetical protein
MHAPFFSPPTPFHRLLSTHPSLSTPPPLPDRLYIHSICRLATLLRIHFIYLTSPYSPLVISNKLLSLSKTLLEHGVHKQGNLEFLNSVCMKGRSLELNDEAWGVIGAVRVAKGLGREELDELGDGLWEVLVGDVSGGGVGIGTGVGQY